MIHINIPKVRGKMAEKGYNCTTMSKALGISRVTFAAYLRRPGIIPFAIVSHLANLLCDTEDEVRALFFNA